MAINILYVRPCLAHTKKPILCIKESNCNRLSIPLKKSTYRAKSINCAVFSFYFPNSTALQYNNV